MSVLSQRSASTAGSIAGRRGPWWQTSATGYGLDPFILDAVPYVVLVAVMLLFATRVRQPGALVQPFLRA